MTAFKKVFTHNRFIKTIIQTLIVLSLISYTIAFASIDETETNQIREKKSPLQEQRFHEELSGSREKVFQPATNESDKDDPRYIPPEWPWKTNETHLQSVSVPDEIDESQFISSACYEVVLPEGLTPEDGIFNYRLMKNKSECADLNPSKPIVPYIVYSGSLQYGEICATPDKIEAEQREDIDASDSDNGTRWDKLKKLNEITCDVGNGLECSKSGTCICFGEQGLVRPVEETVTIKCAFQFDKPCDIDLIKPPATVFNPTLFDVTENLDIGKVSVTCPGTSYCQKQKCHCPLDDPDCPPPMQTLEGRLGSGVRNNNQNISFIANFLMITVIEFLSSH